MKTDIYLISGFLGAGKTTFISRLLQGVLDPAETVVIENDFGEVSLDSSLIRAGGFAVKELNAGCICCSLSGDFQQAILEVIREFSPKQLLIEPSGVGKLSDVEAACRAPKIAQFAQLRRKITVADVLRCQMYLDNFGEFYEDQIRHADAILLSRAAQQAEKTARTRALLTELAPDAQIFTDSWDTIHFAQLLGIPEKTQPAEEPKTAAACKCGCHGQDDSKCDHDHGHHHGECDHDHGHHDGECRHDHWHPDECEHDYEHKHGECGHNHEHSHGECGHHHHDGCGHDHTAPQEFDTVTLSLNRPVTRQQLETAFHAAESKRYGTLLRAKGIVNTPDGPAVLQYLPGELHLTPCTLAPGELCLIGKDLQKETLSALFGKE